MVNAPHPSRDLIIVPLTSRTDGLLPGEFVLTDWSNAGLHVETAVKRGLYTIHDGLVLKVAGRVAQASMRFVDESLRRWLGL